MNVCEDIIQAYRNIQRANVCCKFSYYALELLPHDIVFVMNTRLKTVILGRVKHIGMLPCMRMLKIRVVPRRPRPCDGSEVFFICSNKGYGDFDKLC